MQVSHVRRKSFGAKGKRWLSAPLTNARSSSLIKSWTIRTMEYFLRPLSIFLVVWKLLDIALDTTSIGVYAFVTPHPQGRFSRRVATTRVGCPGGKDASTSTTGTLKKCDTTRSIHPNPRYLWPDPDTVAAAKEDKAGSASPGRYERARITVRQAREPDFEAVASIRAVTVPIGMDGATGFMGSKVVIKDPAEARKRRLMAKVADLVSGEAVALIALERKTVVGAVDCTVHPGVLDPATATREGSRVFLGNLFVLQEHRRRGIARQLVGGAEAFAKKRGATAISLQVEAKNTPAIDLYRKCGFEEERGGSGSQDEGIGGALLRSLGMGKRNMVKHIT